MIKWLKRQFWYKTRQYVKLYDSLVQEADDGIAEALRDLNAGMKSSNQQIRRAVERVKDEDQSVLE